MRTAAPADDGGRPEPEQFLLNLAKASELANGDEEVVLRRPLPCFRCQAPEIEVVAIRSRAREVRCLECKLVRPYAEYMLDLKRIQGTLDTIERSGE